MRLRVPEKILLHLYEYRRFGDDYTYPIEITQQGIANAVGISVTHVPRNIKKLLQEGLVESKKGHVSGKKKRLTVYILTHRGIAIAKELVERVNSMEVEVGGERVKISTIKRATNMKYVEILNRIENGTIEKASLSSEERVLFSESSVKVVKFLDREEEINILKNWLSDGKVMCIIGGPGTGKTYLMRRFLDISKPKINVLWFDIYPGRKWSTIKEIISSLFGASDVLNILRTHPTLLIFDGYQDVDDEFVSALNSLMVDDIGNSKILVSMRADTPYYNRFYTLADVAESRVQEIKLGPLPYEYARKILPDVKESAFKRIYQLAKGNPRVLTSLKKGTIDKEEVPLTPENVHLLKFLAKQK